MKFLMGLNESFSQVKTQILLMDSLPSVNKAYSLFIQEEMQRSVGSTLKVDSTTLATKSQNLTTFGHNGKGKERPLCTHCGKLGHKVDKCYKLHGFLHGFKFKNNKNALAHQVSSNLEIVQVSVPVTSADCNSVVGTSHAPFFTHDQYQQLLTLIGSCFAQQVPKGPDSHVANAVTFPSNTVVGNSINLKHLVFSPKIVNRRAYGVNT